MEGAFIRGDSCENVTVVGLSSSLAEWRGHLLGGTDMKMLPSALGRHPEPGYRSF